MKITMAIPPSTIDVVETLPSDLAMAFTTPNVKISAAAIEIIFTKNAAEVYSRSAFRPPITRPVPITIAAPT
jgi:hypothetical protein